MIFSNILMHGRGLAKALSFVLWGKLFLSLYTYIGSIWVKVRISLQGQLTFCYCVFLFLTLCKYGLLCFSTWLVKHFHFICSANHEKDLGVSWSRSAASTQVEKCPHPEPRSAIDRYISGVDSDSGVDSGPLISQPVSAY